MTSTPPYRIDGTPYKPAKLEEFGVEGQVRQLRNAQRVEKYFGRDDLTEVEAADLMEALSSLPGFLQPVAQHIVDLMGAVLAVGSAFKEGGLLAALAEMKDQLPTITGAILGVATGLGSQLLDALAEVD